LKIWHHSRGVRDNKLATTARTQQSICKIILINYSLIIRITCPCVFVAS